LFALGIFWKWQKYVEQNFRLLFFHRKRYVLGLTNMGWATIWATFLQTHLVILAKSNVKRELKWNRSFQC
jgi:hypothetical protein